MKVSTTFAVLIGLLINLTIDTDYAESRRIHSTLSHEEASLIIGGDVFRDCGPVEICYYEADYCKDSTSYRCADKTVLMPVPGTWEDCNIVDVTKEVCYSTATATCMNEYSCVWVGGVTQKCVSTGIVETPHTAPQFCSAP